MLQDHIETLIDNFTPDNLKSFLAEKDKDFEFSEIKYQPKKIFREIKLLA